VLDLIEKKPHGVLVVADDENKGPSPTDKGFVGKVCLTCVLLSVSTHYLPLTPRFSLSD
jgi:hypothetical protein